MKSEEIKALAESLTEKYMENNQLMVTGAKIICDYIYVMGEDFSGFPNRKAHLKINIRTKEIVATYGCYDCPVKIEWDQYIKVSD